MVAIEIQNLLKARVHIGHKVKAWNPRMFPYIHSEQNKIHIIDVVQTAYLLDKAKIFVNKAAQEDQKILFVGTKPQAATLIANEAKKCNSYYVNYRWLGGMLTNWSTVSKRIERLKKLESQEEDRVFDILPKKEASIVKKELRKLRLHLNGIKDMATIPDIIIVIDQKKEITAVKEAIRLKIPIISIVDTNCNPDIIDLPIPGNDDSIASIKLILQNLSSSILEGQQN